jgi:hypothetical protein
MAEKIIPIPEKITEIADIRRPGLRRSWRMHPVGFIFLLIFTIFWDCFLVFWFTMTTHMPEEMGLFRLFFIFFPILHVAIGVALPYWLISSLFNNTDITFDGTFLRIHHGPVYWGKDIVVPLTDIAQLYVVEANSTDSYGRVSRHYEVNMIDQQRKVRKLLKNLQSAAEALYIEKYLEKLMSLKDEPVLGAYEG